jgi:hypothetical protein
MSVRKYCAYQCSAIDPQVEPLKIAKAGDGTLVVDVHQVVKNLEWLVLIDETFKRAFRLDAGLVKRFDIQSDTQLTGIHATT